MEQETIKREAMEFDVVVVGAGPAGLSTAIRLKQLAQKHVIDMEVAVVEKAAEIGGHIVSGALFEPTALHELFPDWHVRKAPLQTKVTDDRVYHLISAQKKLKLPNFLVPQSLHNQGNYVISLANLCRWLGEQAESLDVQLLPGFAAAEIIYEQQQIKGVITRDQGLDQQGKPKTNFNPGYQLLGKYVIFAEGCRGHLGKQLIQQYQLDQHSDPQHYGIGFKELWHIDPALHQPGLVLHTSGWPLDHHTEGGGFLYHMENSQVALGQIIALNYTNPYLSPYDEFQRWKQHPLISQYLQGGKRISYGARAVNKGGFFSLPELTMPGGLLVGCDAGFLNGAKIKGTHTAMKSGMLAAEAVFEQLKKDGTGGRNLSSYTNKVKDSWLYQELYQARNFSSAFHKFGTLFGGAYHVAEQNIFKNKLPIHLHNKEPDYGSLKKSSLSKPIVYPKPDQKISFDKLSSLYLAHTHHQENQPVHLQLKDTNIPIRINLPEYAEPAQRYCPAGVYEILEQDGRAHFQINAQNCIHCKVCDIKDPSQNINWTVPEGGDGPNYPDM